MGEALTGLFGVALWEIWGIDPTVRGGQQLRLVKERVWQITQATATVKQITVTSTVRSSVGRALVPKSTVVALKASQF